jgi:hypothetical protein
MKVIDAIKHPMFGTQEKLAKALGTPQSCISDWLKRGRLPSHHQLTVEALTGLRADSESVKDLPHIAAAIRKNSRAA